MSSAITPVHAGASDPAKVFPKPPAPSAFPLPVSAPKPAETHHAAASAASTALSPSALSSTDVAYVESLMGAIPAQRMEEILLKTGVPIPANLGPNVDVSA